MEKREIETHEEHEEKVRSLWRWGIRGGAAIFLFMGTLTLVFFIAGYDSRKVLQVSTSMFQVVVLAYGAGFVMPYFLTTLLKLNLGIDMNRKALELGTATANNLQHLKDEIEPVINKAEQVVDKIVPIVENASEVSPKIKEMSEDIARISHKIRTATDNLNGSFDIKAIEQKLDKVAESLSTLAGVFTVPRKHEPIITPKIPDLGPASVRRD